MCTFLTLKVEFENQLNQLLEVRKERTLLMTDKRYNELVSETKEAIERRRCGLELSGLHYRRLKRFDIITVDGREKLVQRNENEQNIGKMIHFCMARDMFDAIHSVHLKIGHKKEKGMELELKKMYCNITREVIAIYLKLCQTCALKRKYKEKVSSAKVEFLPDLSLRCQIDIIDMEVETYQGFRYILNYQDHLTKFLILRPLKKNTPEEVADVLFDIFCLIGVPSVFLCSNEYGFCEKILQSLSENFNVNLARGEYQEDVIKRISHDIFKTVSGWISHNGSSDWVSSLRIIQSLKNRCFNQSIKRSPFEALFGNRQSFSLFEKNSDLIVQTEDELRSKIDLCQQKLDQVKEIRKEISKSHEEALQRSVDIQDKDRCLNCGEELNQEVFCWKCNGPLHFNCALTNDASENSFCKICASKTIVVHDLLKIGKKRKVEEFDGREFDLEQQRWAIFNNNSNIADNIELGDPDQSLNYGESNKSKNLGTNNSILEKVFYSEAIGKRPNADFAVNYSKRNK